MEFQSSSSAWFCYEKVELNGFQSLYNYNNYNIILTMQIYKKNNVFLFDSVTYLCAYK